MTTKMMMTMPLVMIPMKIHVRRVVVLSVSGNVQMIFQVDCQAGFSAMRSESTLEYSCCTGVATESKRY